MSVQILPGDCRETLRTLAHGSVQCCVTSPPYMEKAEQSGNGAALRSVWWIAPAQTRDGHFAVMPENLAALCILAGSRAGDTVLDPFGGSGTTAVVAEELGRRAILCELAPHYLPLIQRRLAASTPGLALT